MSYGYWKPYVPVARRRAQAEKAVTKAKKAGQDMRPVVVAGRTIAKTFWGKAWCDNLEAYSDFENRLPRGRTYVRNGSVIDLKIEPGMVRALVVGSSLYQIKIGMPAVPDDHWRSLAKECTGSIASLVELLQGKLSKAVMERICQPKTGLFPAPKEIQLECSCPDWATMCKHVAAVLYGVGVCLDTQPELLFTLRQVDPQELVTQAAELSVKTGKSPARGKLLDDTQLSDMFGIEMESARVLPDTNKKKVGTRRTKPSEAPAVVTKAPARATTTKKSLAAGAAKKGVAAVAVKKGVAAGVTKRGLAAGVTKKTTDPRPRKKRTQVTVEPAVVRKSANASTRKQTPQKATSSKTA
ncbi:MAG: SWIM zinc finger family protein [Rhodanobacter sp.]|jgi:uncharacterized Zn finger protein